MRSIPLVLAVSMLITGCAQPPMDQPRANGAYLLIEDQQAWIVHVIDGHRVEERGVVVDVIKGAAAGDVVAASYVVETANCGRMQWLMERSDAAEGASNIMQLYAQATGTDARCALVQAQARRWTVLDYSS